MPPSHDEDLAKLLEALLAQSAEGNPPNLNEVCAAHPEFAEELKDLFGTMMVANAAAAFQESSSDENPNLTSDILLTGKASRSKNSAGDVTAKFPGDSKSMAVDLESLPRDFGAYRLEQVLGRGGMGVVYRAVEKQLQRVVALKVIVHGHLASEDDLARFKTEAAAIAQLEHPSIVPIYEFGSADGRPFFTMPLVEGETLAQRLVQGPMENRDAAILLRDLALAVDSAHRKGIIHRDLKPANVLLDEDGKPHITDFGLAKQLNAGESLTQTGAILGTPAYMAPEQASGDWGQLGPASDVYSLGTMLYAALTGRPPLEGPSPVDTVLLLLEEEPLPPRMLNRKIDRDLEMIVLKCLQKPIDLRYATAAALASDLEAYLNGEPIAARSGRFSSILSRIFRDTHHSSILENWGLLWMWHAVVLLILCSVTDWFQWLGIHRSAEWPAMNSAVPYLWLWGIGLGIWIPIFWAIRRRAGPVTSVERQIAHVWGASVAAVMLLFVIEHILKLRVLTLSPILGLTSGMVFIVKASILTGSFYLHAAALFATALIMAFMEANGIDHGIALFGIVSAATFFVPGYKYWHQMHRNRRES